MTNVYSQCARHAANTRCAVALLAVLFCRSAAPASHVATTKDFAEVAAAAMKYADEVGPERVLVVLDIDNTLLAMNHALGSDQWFEWQSHLLKHDPRSKLLVADTFQGLLEAQGLLYNLGRMHPPQRDLPRLVRQLQQRGIHTLVLTSRSDEFRVATERELARNAYDFASSALLVRGLPGGEYMPYELDRPAEDGLTPAEVADFGLAEPRAISYEDGIMMTAGQHKGAMLLTILHRAAADIEAIVYADDHTRHVNAIFEAMVGRGREIAAYHYTREDSNVKRFQRGSKCEVYCQWRKLNRTLEEVFQ